MCAATQMGVTEFRRKWEDFFGSGLRLESKPVAKDLIADLRLRQQEMSRVTLSSVECVDELADALDELKQQAKQREIKEAEERLAEVQQAQRTEHTHVWRHPVYHLSSPPPCTNHPLGGLACIVYRQGRGT